MIPTNQQLRDAHADPNITEAAEIVQELARQGLTRTEICRLCQLPGRTITIRALQEGSLRTMKPEILVALKAGYDRFLTLPDDTTYRRRRSTRREEPVRSTSDAKPQPMTRIEGSRLWDRLADKRKAAA